MAPLKVAPTRPATGVHLNWQHIVFIIYMSSFVTKKPRTMLINFQEIRAYPKIAECLSSAVILYSVYVKCSFISLSNYAKHLIKMTLETVQILIRHHNTRRLIRVYTVCI